MPKKWVGQSWSDMDPKGSRLISQSVLPWCHFPAAQEWLVTWHVRLRRLVQTSRFRRLSVHEQRWCVLNHTLPDFPRYYVAARLLSLASGSVKLREICQYCGVFLAVIRNGNALSRERWVPLCARHTPLSLSPSLSLCCSNKPCSSSSEARNCKLWECG